MRKTKLKCAKKFDIKYQDYRSSITICVAVVMTFIGCIMPAGVFEYVMSINAGLDYQFMVKVLSINPDHLLKVSESLKDINGISNIVKVSADSTYTMLGVQISDAFQSTVVEMENKVPNIGPPIIIEDVRTLKYVTYSVIFFVLSVIACILFFGCMLMMRYMSAYYTLLLYELYDLYHAFIQLGADHSYVRRLIVKRAIISNILGVALGMIFSYIIAYNIAGIVFNFPHELAVMTIIPTNFFYMLCIIFIISFIMFSLALIAMYRAMNQLDCNISINNPS